MYQSNYGYYPNNTGLRQTIAPQVPMAQPMTALKGHPVSSPESFQRDLSRVDHAKRRCGRS